MPRSSSPLCSSLRAVHVAGRASASDRRKHTQIAPDTVEASSRFLCFWSRKTIPVSAVRRVGTPNHRPNAERLEAHGLLQRSRFLRRGAKERHVDVASSIASKARPNGSPRRWKRCCLVGEDTGEAVSRVALTRVAPPIFPHTVFYHQRHLRKTVGVALQQEVLRSPATATPCFEPSDFEFRASDFQRPGWHRRVFRRSLPVINDIFGKSSVLRCNKRRADFWVPRPRK